MHPEKNKCITKQQVKHMKFTSQISAKTDFIFDRPTNQEDTANNDSQLKATSDQTEETSLLLLSDRQVTLKNLLTNTNKRIDGSRRNSRKMIITSYSDSCLNDQQKRLSIKR